MKRADIGRFIAIISILLLSVACSKEVEVMSVSLSENSMTLMVGETATLVATVVPSVADYDGINWISSDPSVVTVTDGVIQVHKVGSAIITASAGGVTSRACTVTVDVPVVRVNEPEEPSEPAENAETAETTETNEATEATEDTENAGTEETVETTGDSEEPEVVQETAEEARDAELEPEPEPAVSVMIGKCFVYDVDFGEKGSYIDIDSLITVTDWRGRDFEDYPNYWGYYGPFEFTVDIANAECDLNGTRQTLPQSITLVQTEAGTTTVKDPSSGSEVTLPANRHGFLICKFTTVGLTEGFNIFIKAKVKYGFGTIQTDWIAIPVVMGIPE